MLSLIVLGLAVAYSAFLSGGSDAFDMSLVAFTVACAAAVRWIRARGRGQVRRLEPYVRWPLILLVGYTAFQLVPLPLSILRTLSPATAGLVQAAGPAIGAQIHSAPLSLSPGAGWQQFIRIAACVLLFVSIREIAIELPRVWIAIAPVLAIAGCEALLGCLEWYFGGMDARGTWPNRNHFANFLGMCLPLAVTLSAREFQKSFRVEQFRAKAAMLACAAVALAALLLVAIAESSSRMGFVAALLGSFVAVVLALAPDFAHARRVMAANLAAAIMVCALPVLAVFVLAPPQLIARFSQVDFSAGLSKQDRVQLWTESLPLVRTYPVFGTGLGAYGSVFPKYKVTSPMVRDEFAHNDYLQLLIELGSLGFLIALAVAAGIFARTARVAAPACAPEDRELAAACCGSFVVILLHSSVDFSLYIPANALLLAWIAGVACSLRAARPLSMTIVPVRAAVPVSAAVSSRKFPLGAATHRRWV